MVQRRQHVVLLSCVHVAFLHLLNRSKPLWHLHEALDEQRGRSELHFGTLLPFGPIFSELDFWRLFYLERAASGVSIKPAADLTGMLFWHELLKLQNWLAALDCAMLASGGVEFLTRL